MVDNTFLKGFRTSAAYFVESTYGTYSISNTKARRIGGKLKGVNWTARQNIIQTGSIGQGRNYTQQIYGQYDASASLNYEVVDFSFLRFAVGDLAKWNNVGTAETTPYFLIEAETAGVYGTTTSNGQLGDAVSSSVAYTNIKLRPFSMLLYDVENVSGGDGATYNDNVDMLMGCTISDFTLSAAVGTPMTCNVNMLVREIAYRRYLSQPTEMPNFAAATTSASDLGNGDYLNTSTTAGYGTPAGTQAESDAPPLMFYGGTMKITNASGGTYPNVMGQVTSFTYTYNNSVISYRTLGDRFIQLPQIGMRRQTLSANMVFRLPVADSTLQQGLPVTYTNANGQTTILEMIRNYLGYQSTATTTDGGAPFTTSDTLRPTLATSTLPTPGASTGSPQTTQAVEKYRIQLYFTGTDDSTMNTRGATINVYNAAIDGFGVPIQLENGLIEIPVNFSVRGIKYKKTSDGTYNGHLDGSTTTFAGIAPVLTWWV